MKEYAGIDFDTPTDIFPMRPGKPAWAQKINAWEKGPGGRPVWRGRSLISYVRQYHQGVLAIDEGINRLLATLEETGQRKNTLIVFTSDQGLAWGQHGFRGTKVAPYDATIRSPLIVSFPGKLPQGAVCPTPVGGVDIIPTFFRFAGIELPWEMHGNDLTPAAREPECRLAASHVADGYRTQVWIRHKHDSERRGGFPRAGAVVRDAARGPL